MQVRTLVNPTLDKIRDVQKSLDPNILYFQGEKLENEEEIGSLVWGTVDVSEPQIFSSLIGPSLPTIVSYSTILKLLHCLMLFYGFS